MSTRKKTKVEEKFSEFFEKWVAQLEELLRQLVRQSGGGGDLQEELIGRVTGHVKGYYTAKWAAAREDVLAFYSPAWLTPLEASFQWVTGWKPSTVFRLLDATSMTELQAAGIHDLRARVRADEERVEREMERQQVAVADRRVVELSRRGDDGVPVVGGMLAGLERVMKAADCVRLKALKGVLDHLTPPQCVDFLAGVSMLQLHLRHCGRRRSSAAVAAPVPSCSANGLALAITSSILT